MSDDERLKRALKKRCSFCGEGPAIYVEGFWLCETGDCDDELRDAVLQCEAGEREEFEERFR